MVAMARRDALRWRSESRGIANARSDLVAEAAVKEGRTRRRQGGTGRGRGRGADWIRRVGIGRRDGARNLLGYLGTTGRIYSRRRRADGSTRSMLFRDSRRRRLECNRKQIARSRRDPFGPHLCRRQAARLSRVFPCAEARRTDGAVRADRRSTHDRVLRILAEKVLG